MTSSDRQRASDILWMHGVEWPPGPNGGPLTPPPSRPPEAPRRPRCIDPEASLALYQMGIE